VENVTTGYTPPLGGPVGAPFPGGYSECWTAEDIPEQGAVHARGAARDDTGRHWFNMAAKLGSVMPILAGDRTEVPHELLMQHDEDSWWKAYAVKLQAGDVLFIDNLSVQHGRMPFKDRPDAPRHMMALVYE
jgi:hypothetical protein